MRGHAFLGAAGLAAILFLLVPALRATAGDPCCSVIAIGKDGRVTARNVTTGRTYRFTVPAARLAGLKVGDPVEMDHAKGVATRLAGLDLTGGARLAEPEAATPCCDIVSIQAYEPANRRLIAGFEPVNEVRPSGFEPVNEIRPAIQAIQGIVVVQNRTTGRLSQFTVTDRSVLRGLSLGQTVSMDEGHTFAMLQSSASGAAGGGAAATRGTYSYPLAGTQAGAATAAAVEKWEILPLAEAVGSLGRLLVSLPEGGDNFDIQVYEKGTTNKLEGGYGNKHFDMLPGEYDVTILGAPVSEVPVQKGKATRVRAGILSVQVGPNTPWHCYSADKKTKYTGGFGPKKPALPVGVYEVQVSGTFRRVEIKDNKMTEL